MYTDELKQLQSIFNNAIESEKRVQKFIKDRLKEKCKISQDDIIFIEEARKCKSAEEFGQNIAKPTRTLSDVKVGETISIKPPKDTGYMSSKQWYGDKTANQYNGREACGIGKVVAVNPKTVRIEYGNGKSYLVSKDALATNDLTPIIDTYGNKPTAIQDFYNAKRNSR